jgi:cytosine/adenosine deaminase-related metal-dependent hydrolase
MAEITSKQERAILAMLTLPTIKDAATQANVTEQTLHRWLKEDAFHSAYLRAHREAYQQAVAFAQKKVSEATQTLCTVMNNTDAKGSERVSAAKAIMDFATRGIEIEDHEQRLKEIEARLAAAGQR